MIGGAAPEARLAGVTLACIDTVNHALALRALDRSRQSIDFARCVLLTDALPADVPAPDGIETVSIAPLASRDDYSRFILKDLAAHIDTAHVLLVQWDGYIVNPAAWDDAFVAVDYLGARWFWHDDGHDVGNGGFSLRSRRLLAALQDSRITLVEAEDVTIGRAFRDLLERDHGIRFAQGALADRFAFEAAYPIGRPFGFHGLYNFCRVVPPTELAALVSTFSPAIVRSPQLAQLLRNCVAMAQWAPAIAIAKRLLETIPEQAEARALLARSEVALARGEGIGRNDPCPCGSGERYKRCHGAVGTPSRLQHGNAADALISRGMQAQQAGDLDAAEQHYRAALAAAPEHPFALHYLGMTAHQQDRSADALPMLQRSAALVADEPDFHNNLGLALAALDRDDEALAAYREALRLRPDHTAAWNNLGLALHARNALTEAIDAYRRALAFAPGFTQARWNLALALLHDGRFAEGWAAYEARLAVAAFAARDVPATPRWKGDDPRGRTLLLVAEQGLGDAIQFVRFAAPLAARGARVIVQAPRAVARLLRSAEGVSEVIAAGDPYPRHDVWLPLLSVPGVLGIDASNIPARVPYLRADAALRSRVDAALAPLRGTLRVGIAWAGSRSNSNDRRRSIALPSMTHAVLQIEGVCWVSLQNVEDPAPPAGLVQLPWRNDFDGLAALIQALDLVVTVDTSIAHLAGALARPVFILLPFSSDWRWRTSRTDSGWYPTATLFRQSSPGDWSVPLAAAAASIRERRKVQQ